MKNYTGGQAEAAAMRSIVMLWLLSAFAVRTAANVFGIICLMKEVRQVENYHRRNG